MNDIKELSKLVRYYSLITTREAGSGHLTSSLSATDLMTTLLFGGYFKFDVDQPENPCNDRLIFSKGHASPLFYSLWFAAGALSEEKLMHFRKLTEKGAEVQGHPTTAFAFAEATTGSLGQGLSIGVGLAINAKYLDSTPTRTYVLLGDSEMAEGSVWEAAALASHYKLNNLVAIVDVNRLGQRGETMYGHNMDEYARKAQAFGWRAIVVDGHSIEQVQDAYEEAQNADSPVMIIGKTVKGKGFSFCENKDGWHGKAPNREECEQALKEFGTVDARARGRVALPLKTIRPAKKRTLSMTYTPYAADKAIATRRAYGHALEHLGSSRSDVVVLDAETSNSTYAEFFKKQFPSRFFEMFIAEQNMVGTALGLSRAGKKPFVSSFAAFLTRAFDQIRMSAYSDGNIAFCGSHAGVSIGEDGISQMGLEDIAMFRAVWRSVVLYPSDAVSTEKLVATLVGYHGISYIRTTRADTPILYGAKDKFKLGGSKTLRSSQKDAVTIIGAGITVHEALKAHDMLSAEGISVRVIDLYSIKPVDEKSLKKAALETSALVVVEDHYAEGGIAEVVRTAISGSSAPVVSLCVRKLPKSGKPGQLLAYEEIDAPAIVKTVKKLVPQGFGRQRRARKGAATSRK